MLLGEEEKGHHLTENFLSWKSQKVNGYLNQASDDESHGSKGAQGSFRELKEV